MKRIDTATKAVDLFGPGKHGFKAGNVLSGEAPTKLAADWFNHVQEEIARLVEEFFGVELDGASVNQLATLFAAKLALYATLESPAFSGDPTAPTQVPGNNTTRLATTEFVATAIANLIASSPAALDTLNELAAALGNDANFATTMTNALALKAPLASPALTGTPTAPTQAAGNNTTRLATTAFVTAAIAVISAASQTQAGLIEIATNEETKAATDAVRAVTPASMKFHPGVATAWLFFQGTAGSPVPLDSYNISSITDHGDGDYTANFATAMANTNFCPVTAMSSTASNINGYGPYIWTQGNRAKVARSTAGIRFSINNSGGGAQDADYVSIAIFGGI